MMKRVLITGGTSGIGLATAHRLAESQSTIVINGRNGERRAQARDGAAIVNVASDAAKVPTPGESVIGAAMAGISMFSRTLAMEAKRRKIRVNVVTPSLVRETLTHDRIVSNAFRAKLFAKELQAAYLGAVDADDVAAATEFLVGKDAAKVTGQVISINGGISAG